MTSWKSAHGEEHLFVSRDAVFAPPKAIRSVKMHSDSVILYYYAMMRLLGTPAPDFCQSVSSALTLGLLIMHFKAHATYVKGECGLHGQCLTSHQ